MYVDKPLSGIKAVQTLSRLNRAHPQKHDVFVLDFMNDTDTIQAAFADYYRTTILSEETDPNKLHDLKAALDGYQVYDRAQVDELVELYLGGADRDQLDPILDACVATYKEQLDEDGQVDFKGKAKAFVRTYGFLAVNPAVHERRVGEAVDLSELPDPEAAGAEGGGPVEGHPRSHRHGQLPRREAGGAADPACRRGRGDRTGADRRAAAASPSRNSTGSPTSSRRSTTSSGNIAWTDGDRVRKLITEDIPQQVAADHGLPERQEELRQAERPDRARQGAGPRHDRAVLKDDTELFKQFSDNESFRRWLTDTVFSITYGGEVRP